MHSVDKHLVVLLFSLILLCVTITSISNTERLRLKHETCYQRFEYSESHKQTWLAEDYCGGSLDVKRKN